jgi:hypothetical protein
LGEQLQARGLGYTPHYTLALMRHRRRELLDAEAGIYRYDQLVVLKETHMPAVLLEAGSIVDRREELALATPERRALESAAIAAAVEEFCAARAKERRGRRRHNRAGSMPRAFPGEEFAAAAHAVARVWLRRNASVLMIVKLIMLTATPAANAGA